MNKRSWMLVTAIVLVVGGGPSSLAAQRGMPGRMDMEQRVRARFGEIVRQRLGITPEVQQAMGQVLQDFQDQREALALRESQLRRRVRSQGGLNATAAAPLEDEAALAVLREMADLRREEVRLAEQEQERLLEILTPGQLVQYYAMRDQLAETVQRLRNGPGPGGQRRGGGGGSVLPGGRLLLD